jgi:hypothetical protein
MPPQAVPAPGEPILLSVDMHRAHLFDADSGERLAAA